jgi:hypothetical protein
MPETLTLLNLDRSEQAERILDAFEERTGLRGERDAQGRIYELASEEQELDVTEALAAIDPGWTDHVALEDPRTGVGG